MRKLVTFTAVSAAALLTAACSSEKTTTFETDGGEGTYTVDTTTGEASGSIETEDGTVNFKSGANVDVDLPDGFTLYPSASVVSNASVDRGDGKGAIITLQSDDAPDEVVAFYRKQAEAAGVKIEMEMKTAQGLMIAGKSESGTTFSLNTNANDEGVTTAAMTIASGLD